MVTLRSRVRRGQMTDTAAALCVLALSVTALLNHPHPGGTIRPVDWAVTFVAPWVLLFQRRAPVALTWLAIGAAWLSTALHWRTATLGLLAVAMLYPLARERSARAVWPPALAIAASIAVEWIRAGNNWTQLWAFAAVLATLVLLGVNARVRHAYLTELERRAHRLEAERDQRARLAVADERARIAREMHDIVAHHLTVIVALSDGAALTAEAAPARAAHTMGQVSTTGRQALGDIRRLVGVLRDASGAPEGRGPQPGLDDLDRLAAQVRAAGVPVRLTQHGQPGAWGPAASLAVYRIVQEALTNVLKHAGPAAEATVEVRYTTSGVEIQVTDRGTGTPMPGEPGAGIAGMRERAESYDGQLTAGPEPDGGWRVHATLCFAEATR